MHVLLIVIFLTACSGGVTLEREAVRDAQQGAQHVLPEGNESEQAQAASPPVSVQQAQVNRLASSSGSARSLFDLDPTTSWEPKGQPIGEWVDAAFQTAVPVTELRFVSCRMGAQANVWVELTQPSGTVRHSVSMASDEIASLPVSGEIQGIRLSVRSSLGRACIAELQARNGEATYQIATPRYQRGTASATTTHEPEEAWSPMFLFDHRLHRGWSAPNKGLGDRVSVSLDTPTALTGFELHNGYQRSDNHFRDNTRARRVRMSADKGPWLEMEFRDMAGAQVVEFPAPVPGSVFEFSFESAYPGDKWEDLVLSELRLSDREGWFSIKAPRDVARERQRAREAEKTSLQEMVDRGWVSLCSDGRVRAGVLKLRPSGEMTWLQSDGAWLDGAWSIASSEAETTTVELYGRWSTPESDAKRPSGGLVTVQDARRMTGVQISAWLSAAPAEVSACLTEAPAEQIASQGAMLVGSPVHDVLVPFQATQAL